MGHITRTATIAATPDQVFETLADRDGAKAWMPAIHAIDPVGEAAMGVGATWIETRRTKRGLVVGRVEVTRFDAGQGFAISVVSRRARLAFRFELKAAGSGTEVEYHADAKGRGFIGFFLTRFITKEVEAEAEPMLARLKEQVEARFAKRPEPVLTEKAKSAKSAKAAKTATKAKATVKVTAKPKVAVKAKAKAGKR